MAELRGKRRFTRKRFVDWLIGTSAGGFLAAVLYPVSRYLIPPKAEESAVNSVTVPFQPTDLAPNSGVIFTVPVLFLLGYTLSITGADFWMITASPTTPYD